MVKIPNPMRSLLFFAAAWLLCATTGHASPLPQEQATLQNGFTIPYDHRAIVGSKVRLYLDKSEESFIELGVEEIASTETLPAPPPEAAPKPIQPAVKAAAKGTPAKKSPLLSTADLHEILTVASTEHNVDVDLLASIIKAESGGNSRAVSHAGAQGLMQLMPATAAAHGVNDSFAPDQNIRGGSAYIDELLTRYHDNLALALAAYNAGPAAVDKYKGIPPYAETRAYVARVIHEFNRRIRAREAAAKAAPFTNPQQQPDAQPVN